MQTPNSRGFNAALTPVGVGGRTRPGHAAIVGSRLRFGPSRYFDDDDARPLIAVEMALAIASRMIRRAWSHSMGSVLTDMKAVVSLRQFRAAPPAFFVK